MKIGEQLGDIFTKALNRDRVSYLYNKLGMINIYAPTLGGGGGGVEGCYSIYLLGNLSYRVVIY